MNRQGVSAYPAARLDGGSIGLLVLYLALGVLATVVSSVAIGKGTHPESRCELTTPLIAIVLLFVVAFTAAQLGMLLYVVCSPRAIVDKTRLTTYRSLSLVLSGGWATTSANPAFLCLSSYGTALLVIVGVVFVVYLVAGCARSRLML